MKLLIVIVALFALLATGNCVYQGIICNFTDTACTNIAFCTGFNYAACQFTTTNGPYIFVSNQTTGYVSTYPAVLNCLMQTSVINNNSFSFNTCQNPSGSSFSFKVMANTTAVWQLSYSYPGNSTCPIPGPSGSVTNVGGSYCAAGNCTLPTYPYSFSSYIVAGCSLTRQVLPATYTYGSQLYTDSMCTNLYSYSGGTVQATCTQTGVNSSSIAASATCSTSQSVANTYNTSSTCSGTPSGQVVTNGSCSASGAYYLTLTCGSASGTTTGATTTGASTTGASTTGASTSTGGTSATTTNSASPVFVHAAVIVLSVLVLLGLFF